MDNSLKYQVFLRTESSRVRNLGILTFLFLSLLRIHEQILLIVTPQCVPNVATSSWFTCRFVSFSLSSLVWWLYVFLTGLSLTLLLFTIHPLHSEQDTHTHTHTHVFIYFEITVGWHAVLRNNTEKLCSQFLPTVICCMIIVQYHN